MVAEAPPAPLPPLSPMVRPQVTRSVRFLRGLAAFFYAIALVAGFSAGAWWMAQGLEAIGLLRLYPVAFVAWAALAMWLSRRLKL